MKFKKFFVIVIAVIFSCSIGIIQAAAQEEERDQLITVGLKLGSYTLDVGEEGVDDKAGLGVSLLLDYWKNKFSAKND